ncbi:MAG: DUF1016 family protein [Verrucomicrobiales bacterium]|nr:DUF1016 family protein [Verrucomicrobiales bacterium]
MATSNKEAVLDVSADCADVCDFHFDRQCLSFSPDHLMNFDQLITSLRELDTSLRGQVIRTANVGLTLRNWLVGAYIVEFEQNGEERAEYGANLIREVFNALDAKGLTPTTLELCRRLFSAYPQISQTLSVEFINTLKIRELGIPQSLSAELASGQKSQTVSDFSARPAFAVPVAALIQKLTFSHFVELLRLDDPLQRAFYEIECVKTGWSVRELKRQIGSLLFERLGLSTDKEKLLRLTAAEVTPSLPADIIKDPYIFEFLGLKPKEVFRENDLETALLDHLQEFLLELGNGFCFEDRQKKIRIGRSDYFVDLVFYHRKLHCHVLIEFHPMRYEPTEVSLRLCFAKRKRRAFLHRIHKRPEAQTPRTPRGKSQVYVKPFAAKAGLLRGLHHSSGRHQTREIP